jgi:hypothetical protein
VFSSRVLTEYVEFQPGRYIVYGTGTSIFSLLLSSPGLIKNGLYLSVPCDP